MDMKKYSQDELEQEFKFDDDFTIDKKGVFQDLHQLGSLSNDSTSFNADYANHVLGYDPFGLVPYDSGSNEIDLSEFKPLQQVNDYGTVMNFDNQDENCAIWTYDQHDQSTSIELVECPIIEPPILDSKPMSVVIADEGSCVISDNRIKNGYRKSCKGKNNVNLGKEKWTKKEDRVLKEMVEKYGVRKWAFIAKTLGGRIGKQCRERWHNHLRPDIKKDLWTEEEDRILVEAHAEVGNKWSEIAKRLPGRTENSTKNHWNATKRRLYTRRKCRSKWLRPSQILLNYIKSLDLPKGRVNSKRSNKLVVVEKPEDFDLNELPELAMDDKLLERDENIESLLNDVPSNNDGGTEVDSYLQDDALASNNGAGKEVDSYLQDKTKDMDLMEIISIDDL